MNFALAREIYGMTPWHVDEKTLPGLMGVLSSLRTGVSLDIPEQKYNSIQILRILNNEVRYIENEYQLNNSEDFKGVGIINLDGAITVSGGASSYGMRSVSETMQKMAQDSRIVGFMIYTDSGGGASSAVEIMSDTINEIRQEYKKPVIGLVKKGGIAASAAYGILTACDAIYTESEMATVGSAGTMVEFVGKAANSEDQDGFKYIRRYAPQSTRKNEGYEQALNNDNYKIIDDDLLAPINNDFLARIERNRPALKGTGLLDGRTVFAKDAIGTFIDGIKSFNEVVQEALSLADTQKINNPNTQEMTAEELKQQHPAVYQSIFNAGAASERDRVGAWMAHADTDIEAVKKGIEGGEVISMKQTQEFIVKQASLSHLKSLQTDSAKDIATDPAKTETPETTENKEVDDFYSKVDSSLNINKKTA